MGRGRAARNAQQQGPYPPQGPPQGPPPGAYGQAPNGQGQPRPAPARPSHGQQGWPPVGGGQQGGHGEPEYFGDPYGAPRDPYANNPGHTQAFSIHDPYGQDAPYGPDPYGQAPYGPDGGYGDGNTYAAGQSPAPPVGPRLHWKDLLRGIVLRPNATFWQMRDHTVWGPALIVTFLYGLLAVFGLDDTREDVINATMGSALQYAVGTGIAIVIMGLMLGAVTHTLARQFGGNGVWAPTIGLSMLIMSLSDAPRLLFAMFLGGNATLVQVIGWVTWLAAGALFTSMVSRSHDLPWPRALGASAIQLLALLFLMKLGTL